MDDKEKFWDGVNVPLSVYSHPRYYNPVSYSHFEGAFGKPQDINPLRIPADRAVPEIAIVWECSDGRILLPVKNWSPTDGTLSFIGVKDPP